MAVTGTHMLFYTTQPEALREMLRDVFGFRHVDAGSGWLIFALPPSEIGVHPAEGDNFDAGARHLISFMCDDIKKTIAELRAKGVSVDPDVRDEGYGLTTMMHLPGGCEVMLYEPRHPIAARMRSKKAKARSASAKKLRRDKPGRRAKKAARRR